MGTTEQHTPTPWKQKAFGSIVGVKSDEGHERQIAIFSSPIDAARAIVCVNALSAFTTEQIEQNIDLVALMEERDKFINAIAVKTATILELRKEIERLKTGK